MPDSRPRASTTADSHDIGSTETGPLDAVGFVEVIIWESDEASSPHLIRRKRVEMTDSPLRPEKIELVSDGTNTMPAENVPITAIACSA